MVYAFFATRIRPQKHYLPKTFFSPKNTLQSSKAPYCRCQYGLLSPYFAALNTGFCRPISLRSIRALATLLPPLGGNALRRSGYVLAAPPLARIRLRNPPVLPLAIRALHRPISLRLIRAFVALFRCAQYGLLLRYCPHSGAMRSAAPAMCSPLRRLRAYAYATRPIALGNTGQSNTIHPIHIKMII